RIDVRDIGDLPVGEAPRLASIVRIDLERAEQEAERDLLLVAERLVREHQHGVAVEGRLDLGKEIVRHRIPEIDAADLGADMGMEWRHADRHETSSRLNI